MHVILSFVTGRRAEGILLAASPRRMRIVVKKLNDTMELHLVDGKWITDIGDPVEIESLITDGQTDLGSFLSSFPKTHTARH